MKSELLEKEVINHLKESEGIKPNSEQLKAINKIKKIIERNFFSKPISKLFQKKISGIYLYGKVGRGKSIIISAINTILSSKYSTKIHFSDLIFELQKIKVFKDENFLNQLAEKNIYFKNQKVICIDELDINNIADYFITEKFLDMMQRKEVLVILTSNMHPKNLYNNEYYKKKTVAFANYIDKNYKIIEFKYNKDYRSGLILSNHFFFDKNKTKNIKNQVLLREEIVGKIKKRNKIFSRIGNKFCFNEVYNNLLETEFDEICGKNFGQKDYEIILEEINFIFIKNIPILNKSINDKIKRLITLIDIIYERKKILSLSTSKPLKNIFLKDNNSLNFDRTFSRLNELFSKKYISTYLSSNLNL